MLIFYHIMFNSWTSGQHLTLSVGCSPGCLALSTILAASSFASAKESEFFDVISKLDKQVIIATKSFLKEDDNGNTIVDKNKVKSINGIVYRIEKMEPFDDKKLATIQTVITKV